MTTDLVKDSICLQVTGIKGQVYKLRKQAENLKSPSLRANLLAYFGRLYAELDQVQQQINDTEGTD